MRKIVVAIFVTVTLLMTGCNFEISTELFVQDVVDLTETQETIFISTTLAFEFNGEDDDKENVIAFFSDALYQAENFREEDRDNGDTYILVDYMTPLLYAPTSEKISVAPELREHMLAIAIIPDQDVLSVYVAFNSVLLDDLNVQLNTQFDEQAEIANASLLVHLYNDLRTTIDATIYAAYANNVPIPFIETFSLERRDDIEIRFSDVLTDSLDVDQTADENGIRIRKFAEIILQAE